MTSELKITSVRSVPLVGRSPKGGWANEIGPNDSIHALLAVHTSAGITGYGSAFTNAQLVAASINVLEPLWSGENALEPQRVSEKLHQNTFWMGRGGAITHTISAIDIAMWDILGKVTNQPVGRLLGGGYRRAVMPYCSVLMEKPGMMADVLIPFREQGFQAFKIGWGPFGRMDSSAFDEAIVRDAREAIGPDCKLFVDAGGSDAFWPNGLKWAIRTAEMLADYDVGWFEEPLDPDALEDFCHLRRISPVRIAGGEVLCRRQAFTPFLMRGAFDIVQPDVTKVGGISEQIRIARASEDFGVRYIGHGWNTALGVAADLHLAAATPNTDLVEFIGGSAYVDGILTEPFALNDAGLLKVPQGPGLGVELDRDKIARYTPDPGPLFSA